MSWVGHSLVSGFFYTSPEGSENLDFGGPAQAKNAFTIWCDTHKDNEMEIYKKECAATGKEYTFFGFNGNLYKIFKEKVVGEALEKLKQQEAESKAQHQAALEPWQKTDQYLKYKNAHTLHLKKKEIKSAKKQAKDDGMPQKPQTAFFLYCNEHRSDVQAQLKAAKGAAFKISMVTTEMAKKWGELPQETKQKYIDMNAKAKEEYETKMEAYKQTDGYKSFQATVDKAATAQKEKLKRAREEVKGEKQARKRQAKEMTATATEPEAAAMQVPEAAPVVAAPMVVQP